MAYTVTYTWGQAGDDQTKSVQFNSLREADEAMSYSSPWFPGNSTDEALAVLTDDKGAELATRRLSNADDDADALARATTIYTVEVIDDYTGNDGDPVRDDIFHTADLREGETIYRSELEHVIDENGILRRVTLFEGDDEDPYKKELKSDHCGSAPLPPDGVVVYYQHVRYINYAYAITATERVGGRVTRREDLPFSRDYTGTTWAEVFESVDALKKAYDSRWHIFGKINSGQKIVEKFLAPTEEEVE